MTVKARRPSGDSGGYHIGICPDVLITSLNIYSEVYIYIYSMEYIFKIKKERKERREEKRREEKSKEKERKKRNVCTHVVL